MTLDKAGQSKLNGTSKLKNEKVCVHQRVVDYHYNGRGQSTRNVVCRECGAVIPDPAKVLGEG